MPEFNPKTFLEDLRESSSDSDIAKKLQSLEPVLSQKRYSTEDKNFDLRESLVEYIMWNLEESDLPILRILAEIEISYTRNTHYHCNLADVVHCLYELGHKEDVIYAYEVRCGLRNMDAASATYQEILTMRTPKDEMMSYLNSKVDSDPVFLDRYPDIFKETEFAYEFPVYETEDYFNQSLLSYYFSNDPERKEKFYQQK
ncbi:MAG: hypothetical protein AAF655_22380 [Bacteroidota bacterium]